MKEIKKCASEFMGFYCNIFCNDDTDIQTHTSGTLESGKTRVICDISDCVLLLQEDVFGCTEK